jgi:hypothetical protein
VNATAPPALACTDMCTATGFSDSRFDGAPGSPGDADCYCVGPGVITVEACGQLCTTLGKSSSGPFASSSAPHSDGGIAKSDACHCSN